MNTFTGKMLVRRSRDDSGRPVVILCGLFIPNVPADEFDDRDEVWAVKLGVLDCVRRVNTSGIHFSPEDFLENPKILDNGTAQ